MQPRQESFYPMNSNEELIAICVASRMNVRWSPWKPDRTQARDPAAGDESAVAGDESRGSLSPSPCMPGLMTRAPGPGNCIPRSARESLAPVALSLAESLRYRDWHDLGARRPGHRHGDRLSGCQCPQACHGPQRPRP